MARPAPAARAAFPVFRRVQTRWHDNDIYGHVNNTVHYQIFDTVVNGWLIDNGLLTLDNPSHVFIVAETGCRYHAELRFPVNIDAGLKLERLGNSAVVWNIGLFAEGAERAAAEGRFVHVWCRREGLVPEPMPEHVRAALAPLVA